MCPSDYTNSTYPNLEQRISDFHHIVSTLQFPSPASSPDSPVMNIYSISHLNFFGDLNSQLTLPPANNPTQREEFLGAVTTEEAFDVIMLDEGTSV